VETTRRDQARALWRQLALRNQWQLVADEEAFLDQVLSECGEVAEAGDPAIHMRAIIQRIYSAQLYQGMCTRDERAAYELWLMFLRLAVRGGADEATASDLAQESVARVLDKFVSVRSPAAFLSWAMMVFRTAQRDLRPKRPELSLTTEAGELTHDPADPSDLTMEVEARLAEQEFRDVLRDAISNDLERLTLIRCVIFDDDPRDVARDLSLPLYRTRVAKSRALQRLRGNDRFMNFIGTFAMKPQALRAAGEAGDG